MRAAWPVRLLPWIVLGWALPVAARELPRQAAIASAHHLATEAGIEVLQAGGNAYDAAVAVSAALSVVEPESSGIGGGGFFLLVPKEGEAVFVDARETAPAAAHRDMYLDPEGNPVPRASIDGARAAAVPGLPAALVHVSTRYGRLPLGVSLAPAIRLAREGFPFSEKNRLMLGFGTARLSPAAARLYLRDGQPLAEGSTVRNPDLARVLERLARDGHDGFYRGRFANELAAGVRRAGGLITASDLAGYRVVERAPLVFEYRGRQVITAPPPSSGGVALATALQVLAGYELAHKPAVDRVHLIVEALRRAYRDRAIHLGDPDYVEIPLPMLLSPWYAAGLRASIHPTKATASDDLPGIEAPMVGDDTTHFSIVDRDGNVAAVTQTVNLPYGAGVVIPGTGFLLNNEMDDFSLKAMTPNAFGLVGQDANAIAPGKRPLSSMTPTVLIGDEAITVIGTPGGSRIISMVLLGVLAALEGASAEEIVALPRFHHQYLPDTLGYEPGALAAEQVAALARRGHVLQESRLPWGNMQVVRWLADGRVEAGSDPRNRVGAARLGGPREGLEYR